MNPDEQQPTTELLAKYAVSEAEYPQALAVIERFKTDPLAASVLWVYYAELPEAREEAARELRLVAKKQGAAIFALQTTAHCYLYLAMPQEARLLGPCEEGLGDVEILDYFDFRSARDFREYLPKLFAELPAADLSEVPEPVCVVCGVTEGEEHVLGCPVEPCPWCDGQLNRCNCRFDLLGVDSIEDEELLERFEELLESKGRVAFTAEQSPSYPTAGTDPGPGGSPADSEKK